MPADAAPLRRGPLVARVSGTGAVALAENGVSLTTASQITVTDEMSGATWTFGPQTDDRAQTQRLPGLWGARIADGGLDVRLALGLPPDGAALVVRLDVTSRSALPRSLAVESSATLAAGGWETVVPLDARTAEAAPGRFVAHTLVPDDARVPTEALDLRTLGGEIRRKVVLRTGQTAGWTVCVGVGHTAPMALGAVFPFLSGQRSRVALVAAKEAGQG